MKLGKDGRAYIHGKIISLITGKDIDLIFLVDPGSTSGQLSSIIIGALEGQLHHTSKVEDSLGEELDRKFYDHIRIELPGTDAQGKAIILTTEAFIGKAVPGKGAVIGANQLLEMKADLLIKYGSKEFSLIRNF